MKQLLLLTLTVLFINACGVPLSLRNDRRQKTDESRQFATTDSAFATYVATFEQQGAQKTGNPDFRIGDIPINFGDTENPHFQGVCFEYSDGTKEIIIQKNWWDNVDQSYRESLLFHELGHCRLGREHDNTLVPSNDGDKKLSMMSAVIVNSNEYSANRDAYLTELFTQNVNSLLSAFSP